MPRYLPNRNLPSAARGPHPNSGPQQCGRSTGDSRDGLSADCLPTDHHLAGTAGTPGSAGSLVGGFWNPGGQGTNCTDGTGGQGGGGGGHKVFSIRDLDDVSNDYGSEGQVLTMHNGKLIFATAGGGTVETPTGTVNGSNTSFTVTAAPQYIVSDGITVLYIKPKINPFINWQEAMRQELVFLTSKNVINLDRDSVESISALANKGQSGQNYRIVLDPETNEWVYYDKTSSPALTSQRECKGYSEIKQNTAHITGNVTGIAKNPFYLVPLTIFFAGILALLLLAIIARSINSYRRNKPKAKVTA